MTGGMDEFEGSRGNAGVSSRIQAVAGMAGVYDFVGRFSDPEQVAVQPQMKTKIQTNGEWIGTPFSATDHCWQDASAINHLDPSDPPILLMHSKNDRVLPWMQSRNMFLKLQDAGVPSMFELYETGGHAVQPKGKDPKAAMISFFKAHLEN